ncbi:hypothetical protein HAX54_018462 [Datura stramonium]|uniref:Uncharacterized protein n=1 Tax=Datura stramonium TaxID=4076 RepID=A0ABS8UP15_DATST|nr:hypothetical protein [Datura stramonium]
MTQAKEINDKPESPGYLDVLGDHAGVIVENEAASSQSGAGGRYTAIEEVEVTKILHMLDRSSLLVPQSFLLVLEEISNFKGTGSAKKKGYRYSKMTVDQPTANYHGIFVHLPPKLLNNEWIYEQKKDLPKNYFGSVCGPYSLAFNERLIHARWNLLNDNTMSRSDGDGLWEWLARS